MDKPKPNKLAQFYSGQIQPNGALSLRRSVQFWSGVDSRAEKICLTSADAGLICCEKLANELGLPVFVTMPNIRQLIDELSRA